MKWTLAHSILLSAPALLFGQATILPMPAPVPSYNELKTYLNLTEAQVQSLRSVQTNRNQAIQAINSQIAEKYKTLYSLLGSDSGTAVQLGQLLLDIRALQKQFPLNDGPYKTEALNVLAQDQKNKLPALSQALQLQAPAWQAISLLLIDGPAGPRPCSAPACIAGLSFTPNFVPFPMGSDLTGLGAPVPPEAIGVSPQMPPAVGP